MLEIVCGISPSCLSLCFPCCIYICFSESIFTPLFLDDDFELIVVILLCTMLWLGICSYFPPFCKFSKPDLGLYGTPADFCILSVSLIFYYLAFSFLAPLCILLGACDLDRALNCLVLGIPADYLPSLAPEWPPRVVIGAFLPLGTPCTPLCWIWLFILAIWFYSLFLIVHVIYLSEIYFIYLKPLWAL